MTLDTNRPGAAENAKKADELGKLVRCENRLVKRRNSLLAALDVDEYADVDSSAWFNDDE